MRIDIAGVEAKKEAQREVLGKDRHGRDVRKGDRVRYSLDPKHSIAAESFERDTISGPGPWFISSGGGTSISQDCAELVAPWTAEESKTPGAVGGVDFVAIGARDTRTEPVEGKEQAGDTVLYTLALRDGSQRTYATREEYERAYGACAPGADLLPSASSGMIAIPYPLPQPEPPTLAEFTTRVTANVREMAPDAKVVCDRGMLKRGEQKYPGFVAHVQLSHGVEFLYERRELQAWSDSGFADEMDEMLRELGARVMGKK